MKPIITNIPRFFAHKFYDPQWSDGCGSGREAYAHGRSERGREVGEKSKIHQETNGKCTQLRTEVGEKPSEITWDTPQSDKVLIMQESEILSKSSISKEDIDKIATLVQKHGFNLPSEDRYTSRKELVFFDKQGNRHGILFWNRSDPSNPSNTDMVVFYYKDGIKDQEHFISYTIKNNTVARYIPYFWTNKQEAKAEWDAIIQWVADLIAWRGTYGEKKAYKKKSHE